MSDVLHTAEQRLLAPGGLTEGFLQGLLHNHQPLSYGDVFLQEKHSEHWSYEQSSVKEASRSYHCGGGIRQVVDGSSGFAYSEQLNQAALQQAASMAQLAHASSDNTICVNPLPVRQAPTLYTSENEGLDPDAVTKLLHRVDRIVRDHDTRVVSCQLHLQYSHEVMWVINHEGSMHADVRPLIRFDVSVVLEQGQLRESAHAGGGGRYGFSALQNSGQVDHWAREAVRMASVMLEAEPAPAGRMPVVLGPGWTGVLLHEAIGHGLEGDAIRRGSSAFCHRLGERIASAACTVVDDGTLPGRRGSLQVDDEGTPSQCTPLIEEGVLTHYMADRYTAACLGCAPTGNGRRESYAHLPLTRMTNTYLHPGKHAPSDIIASCEHGIYATHFSGGQVDTASGKFVFTANEAYRLERGQIGAPIKGVTLIGDGPSVLQSIAMVGNDLVLDDGIGVCGKEGQWVPVGVGQPTVKLDQLTIGGTSLE